MTDTEHLNAFANIPAVLRKELIGLTHEQLMSVPVPGRWSIHQVAIHVADADAAICHRLKRIIAEDRPAYSAWDENAFIARLAYDQQSAEDAVQLVEINHRQLSKVLKSLTTGWMDRVGVHSVAGPESARDVLHKAVWHIEHHLKFVAEKKAKLGI